MARQPYYPAPDSLGYGSRSRQRIDARPQNSAATQAGMRGVHRDTKGNVIGGYTAEGQGLGTKSGNWRSSMGGFDGMPSTAAPATPMASVASSAATANPNATPLAQKPASAIPGTIGADIGSRPNATGGGLWRWHAMNPTAGKFGEQSPMQPGEIRNAPVVAAKPLGPAVPKAAATTPPAAPVAEKKPSWRKRAAA